ncbi:tetratricopeptide repeat-containing protein [Oleiphilus messinensis]|uniref:Tetratricopeptide repeat-containing protein n=2 Tax=Oleiphilus messinensis TaxID=141451 RepID=A0A1Y0I743_9GAMM|nr:tetratricopeptide repeat-containing protein [Oleiphilus messinensis]
MIPLPMLLPRLHPGVLFAILALILSGCSSLSLQKARQLHSNGQWLAAADALEQCESESRDDRLLCLLDSGTVLYDAGKYQESTRVFLAADAFIREQDYLSISQQTLASVVNDYAIVYQGEYSEQLWLHTYLMMGFLQLHDYEAARVEAKRALEVLDENPDPLQQARYSRALIALCFELFNQFDDARIEYEKIKNVDPDVSIPSPTDFTKEGELVLLLSLGQGPRKSALEFVAPPSIKISIPEYQPVTPYREPDVVVLEHSGAQIYPFSTDTLALSRASLKARMPGIIARQTARVAGKESLAESIGDQNELLEILVRILFFATEHADTRSWLTLPAGFHLVRISLLPGAYDIRMNLPGATFASGYSLPNVEIRAGERIFKSIRF